MDEQINKKKDDSSHDLYKFCQLKCRIPCQMSEEQTITRVGTAIVAHIRGRFYLPRLRQHVFDQPRRKQISSLAARVMILRYHHLIIRPKYPFMGIYCGAGLTPRPTSNRVKYLRGATFEFRTGNSCSTCQYITLAVFGLDDPKTSNSKLPLNLDLQHPSISNLTSFQLLERLIDP